MVQGQSDYLREMDSSRREDFPNIASWPGVDLFHQRWVEERLEVIGGPPGDNVSSNRPSDLRFSVFRSGVLPRGWCSVGSQTSWWCVKSSKNGRGRLGDDSTDSLGKRLSGSSLLLLTLGFSEATSSCGCFCSQGGRARESWVLPQWMVLNLEGPWSCFSGTRIAFCYIPTADFKKIFELKTALAETFVDRLQ